MRLLAHSPVAGKLQEKQGQEDYAIKEIVAKNFDVPCLPQRRLETPASDVQKSDENYGCMFRNLQNGIDSNIANMEFCFYSTL